MFPNFVPEVAALARPILIPQILRFVALWPVSAMSRKIVPAPDRLAPAILK